MLTNLLAIPTANASNQVEKLSTSLLDRSRQFFATNTFGHLERATNGAVRCEELRPDVAWGVLREQVAPLIGTEHAPAVPVVEGLGA